ncbi:MAG: hypothetical protein KA764_08435 [Anaerolineales bacterium]|nr:hypothetical protein [Anaerolineales bacterium]
MPERLEPDIALLNIAGGRPLTAEPPGLASFTPPRKAARGRERDTVFLGLGLRARAPLSAEQTADRLAALLQLAAATFYGTPGSVTAAARQALLAVNQKLLDENLREGATVQGGLICAVLRGTDFYAVVCGAGLVVVTHPTAVERFPAAASRPLGLSDVLDAQYFHTALNAGDYLAITQSARWTEAALSGLGGLATLSAVGERLKEAGGPDFTALAARLEPEGSLGTGPTPAPTPSATPAFSLASFTGSAAGLADRLRRPPAAPAPVEPAPAAAPPPVVEPARPAPPEPAPPAEASPATDWQDLLRRTEHWREDAGRAAVGRDPAADQAAADLAPVPVPRPARTEPAPASPPPAEREPEPETEAPPPFTREAAPRFQLDTGAWGERLRAGARSFGRALGVTVTEAGRSVSRLLARAMPEGTLQRDGMFTIPTSVQISVAVIMPLLIVAVVALIYIQRGQTEQFQEALQQVQVEVTKGRLAADPLAARGNWEAAVAAADRAEALRPDDLQVGQLRLEAQSRLDELDWTTRLEYVPLVPGGFGPEARLAQLTLIGRDVYALDTGLSRVWRLTPNPSGVYARDENFICGSGPLGPLTIGPLVDIGYVPAPNVRDAEAVIALDNAGALLYCSPNETPLGSYLPAPTAGWVQPTALELFADSLYVLDIGQNQVWQFQSSGGVFNQPPAGYFSSVVYDLKDVVDITIAGGDLLLLRQDGRISICSRASGLESANCVEAAPFTDQRLGRAGGERLADLTAPAHLIYDQPPEPSVFILEPARAALVQLSLKLVYTRQFRPARALGAPLTAVAIDPAKRFFIATRDNVYVAARP